MREESWCWLDQIWGITTELGLRIRRVFHRRARDGYKMMPRVACCCITALLADNKVLELVYYLHLAYIAVDYAQESSAMP